MLFDASSRHGSRAKNIATYQQWNVRRNFCGRELWIRLANVTTRTNRDVWTNALVTTDEPCRNCCCCCNVPEGTDAKSRQMTTSLTGICMHDDERTSNLARIFRHAVHFSRFLQDRNNGISLHRRLQMRFICDSFTSSPWYRWKTIEKKADLRRMFYCR
jgi:hypothetical protein